MTDTAIATIAPDATADDGPVEGEVTTPLERLKDNERIIAKGLKAYGKLDAQAFETREEIGAALYEIWDAALWKAVKDANGKSKFKNFGEYLESKGWDKTASRAYQMMADHRKALRAADKPVKESKRGPKANNPGRSAKTFANMLINLRNSMAQRSAAMTGESQGERDFVDIAERFAEATAIFVSEFEALEDRERGTEAA